MYVQFLTVCIDNCGYCLVRLRGKKKLGSIVSNTTENYPDVLQKYPVGSQLQILKCHLWTVLSCLKDISPSLTMSSEQDMTHVAQTLLYHVCKISHVLCFSDTCSASISRLITQSCVTRKALPAKPSLLWLGVPGVCSPLVLLSRVAADFWTFPIN